MKTRRELLMIGGAGGAAMVLPSFLPSRVGGGGVVLAQGRADPIARELGKQFSQIVAGLAATPPRGNARQIAATYRLTAAYIRSTNLDAQLRQKLDEALATEGHQAFVARVVESGGAVADGRRRGATIPTMPSYQSPTFINVAKGIGMLKAEWTVDRMTRILAQELVRGSARFDRQMAIRNGRNPANEMVIRRVQQECTGDPCESWEEPSPPQDTCVQTSANSFSCSLYANTPSPTAPNGSPWPTQEECNNLSFLLGMLQIYMGILAVFFPELWWIWAFEAGSFQTIEWWFGCA